MKRSAALITITLLVALMGPELVSAQVPPMELVEFTNDGRQVTVTVIAPLELQGDTLSQDGFFVDVNGTDVVPDVERISGDDLDIVLLVDVSGSMTAEALAAAQRAGAAFVRQVPVGTRVSLVSFGDEPAVVQTFTTDIEQIITSLDNLAAGGETALYSGVVLAAQQFDPTVDSIRTVVLLSDGGNTVEEGSLSVAQLALRLSEATLHAISIETSEANPAELDALAEPSGGTVARVEQVEAIEELYRSIAINLSNQYRLTFVALGNGATPVRVEARRGDSTVAETSFLLSLPLAAVPALPSITPVPTPTPAPTAAVAPLQVTPPSVSAIDASGNGLLKWSSIVVLAVAIATATILVLTPVDRTRSGQRVRPVQQFSERAGVGASGFSISGMVGSLTDRVERSLRRRPGGAQLATLLDTAGWKVRNSEFVVLVALSTVVAFFAGAISSPGFGLILALLVVFGVGSILMLVVRKRRDAFADQLNATLQMMAGGLRTGYSLPQVLVMVAEESDSPTDEEMSRIVVETRLGRDLVESIASAADRMKSEDLRWASGAIDITRDVGGDLAEVLDNVAETIRIRARVRRQILALSAEGRVSAWILGALPLPIFFWQLFVNADYTRLLFTDPLGRMIFIFAISALVIGIFWMHKLIQVKY